MEKLEMLWKKSSCTIRNKVITYDVAIRSELIYGTEGAQINESAKNKIDAFQVKRT